MECLITDIETVRAQDTSQTEDAFPASKCTPQLCSEIRIRQKSCEINKTGQQYIFLYIGYVLKYF